MSTDENPDGDRGEQSIDSEQQGEEDVELTDVRDRLGEGAGRAVDQFDEGLIDLLAWMLETETRARIYVSLRSTADQTSDEIAERTGLYPSTVREALASMHDDGIVTREKRQNSGAGNNPYEYSAIPPSELVGDVVEDIQDQLNKVFNLDRYIDRQGSTEEGDSDDEPVTITVTDHPPEDPAEGSDGNGPDVDAGASEAEDGGPGDGVGGPDENEDEDTAGT